MKRPYGRRAQQSIEKLLRLGSPRSAEPQLGVVRLLSPLLPILGAIVGQQQNAGTGHTLAQGIEEALGLRVDPVQVLKDEDKGLVKTLAQKELLESIKRSLPPNLRIHLLEAHLRVFDAEQGKEIRQSVFQAAVQA